MILLPEFEDKRKTRSFPTVPYFDAVPALFGASHHPSEAESSKRCRESCKKKGLLASIPTGIAATLFPPHARFRIMPAVETAF
jgi:hypothetical protein